MIAPVSAPSPRLLNYPLYLLYGNPNPRNNSSPADHLDEHNRKLSASASEEKRINYAVASLDLAPFKALRWQRRRLLAASQGGPASQQPVRGPGCFSMNAAVLQACKASLPSLHMHTVSVCCVQLCLPTHIRLTLPHLPPTPLPPKQASQASLVAGGAAAAAAAVGSSQLEEQWEQEPHVMVCFQVGTCK